MVKEKEKIDKEKYSLLRKNCVNAVVRILQAGGVTLNAARYGMVETPGRFRSRGLLARFSRTLRCALFSIQSTFVWSSPGSPTLRHCTRLGRLKARALTVEQHRPFLLVLTCL